MRAMFSRCFFWIACCLFLYGCGQSNEMQEKQSASESKQLQTKFVTIATGGASGPYNIIGTTLANVYTHDLGANSKTQTTGGSIENLNLLAQKKVEMAFVMSDALSDAYSGQGSFPQKIGNIAQVASLYPNFVQIITSKRSGIKTITDLKGKRVAVGDQNSGVERNARALLNAFGITYDDIKVDYLSYAAAADALQNGRIDAAFLTSGLPNASVLQLEKTFDLALVAIPKEQADMISKEQSYFFPASIPALTYSNEEDVPSIAIRNALVVAADLTPEDVYVLTKTFFDNLDKLQFAHQAAKGIIPQESAQGLVIPMHEGAKRYYDEQK